MGYDVIRDKFKRAYNTISKIVEEKGRYLTSDDLIGPQQRKEEAPRLKMAAKRPAPVDRSPGWCEKKYFPNAGNNGFDCMNSSSGSFNGYVNGIPCYTGSGSGR